MVNFYAAIGSMALLAQAEAKEIVTSTQAQAMVDSDERFRNTRINTAMQGIFFIFSAGALLFSKNNSRACVVIQACLFLYGITCLFFAIFMPQIAYTKSKPASIIF